ncbi:hypothetical protein [Actinomadura harenae]|uniref:Uncharacterized protein n=1 Tax=Actinomadura harenae TaxID=2483351 RepID=A0A3M2LGJ7_9ACTN|nr:hypothetical protein [Actinomadura harenae]RMI36619.1 hypothetical protein EBO15_38210 [Actinomadura harenae]
MRLFDVVNVLSSLHPALFTALVGRSCTRTEQTALVELRAFAHAHLDPQLPLEYRNPFAHARAVVTAAVIAGLGGPSIGDHVTVLEPFEGPDAPWTGQVTGVEPYPEHDSTRPAFAEPFRVHFTPDVVGSPSNTVSVSRDACAALSPDRLHEGLTWFAAKWLYRAAHAHLSHRAEDRMLRLLHVAHALEHVQNPRADQLASILQQVPDGTLEELTSWAKTNAEQLSPPEP